MRQAGLRKKIISIRKVPQRKTQRLEEFATKLVALDDKIKQIIKEGGHLVFADEAIFSARGYQMRAWSR
jgi:hypothetical protein